MTNFWNVYLRRPLLWDAVTAVIASIGFYFLVVHFTINTKDITSVQYTFAGTAISLAGFILTALTIIVTLRANISYKGLEHATSGLELIFNSKVYKDIVQVFTGAIGGLIITAAIIFLSMLVNDWPPIKPYLSAISLGGLVVIIASISRCLYILFRIIRIEIASREGAKYDQPAPREWAVRIRKANEGDGAIGNTLPDFPSDFTVRLQERTDAE